MVEDLAFGKMMRKIWATFADTGAPPKSMGWSPILKHKGPVHSQELYDAKGSSRRLDEAREHKHKTTIWAKYFTVANLVGPNCLNNQSACIKHMYKAKECKFWQHAGFGPKFWWAN